MIILDEISTHTKTNIRLHHAYYEGASYWVWECTGHGELSLEYDEESQALAVSRDSRKWCVGCSEGDEIESEGGND